jgi:hypothetical protein
MSDEYVSYTFINTGNAEVKQNWRPEDTQRAKDIIISKTGKSDFPVELTSDENMSVRETYYG